MDCKTAREQINIFDSLNQQQKDELIEHAQGCKKCRKELINSTKLLEELSNLDELEAPNGLAQSAIDKARKKRRVPPYAYISVAAAAVIAVAFFATSSILSPRDNMSESMPMAAKEESMRTDEDALTGMQNEAVFAEAADEGSDMQEMAMDAPEEAYTESDGGTDMAADDASEDADVLGASEICYINVSPEKAEFTERVKEFLSDKGIYYDSMKTGGDTEVLMFVVGELNLEEFKQLLIEHEIEYEVEISAGTLIEMTIEH